ncbi:hypothetical protein ACLOJK_020876 [Asimina triloba]
MPEKNTEEGHYKLQMPDVRRGASAIFDSGVSDVEDFLDANIYGKELQISLFDLRTITMAISDFSDSKKLGEGRFGPVFKGSLPGGQDIASQNIAMNMRCRDPDDGNLYTAGNVRRRRSTYLKMGRRAAARRRSQQNEKTKPAEREDENRIE